MGSRKYWGIFNPIFAIIVTSALLSPAWAAPKRAVVAKTAPAKKAARLKKWMNSTKKMVKKATKKPMVKSLKKVSVEQRLRRLEERINATRILLERIMKRHRKRFKKKRFKKKPKRKKRKRRKKRRSRRA